MSDRLPRRAPIRVLLIGPSTRLTGGQAVQAARLLARLEAEPEIAVTFLPIDGAIGRLVASVPVLRTLLASVRYWLLLVARVPRHDVVHVFSAGLWSFALWTIPAVLVSRVSGRAVIVNYRDGRAPEHLANWRSALPVLRAADQVVTPSEYLVQVFGEHGLAAVAIYNIMDAECFRFRARSPLRPAFMTNRMLEPLYNVECVLRAFALIQSRVPAATLTIAHDGPCRGRLEELARRLDLRNVTFAGRVSNLAMAALYEAADIYLMSPNIDNMPGTLLECFAAGLPVVTTNAGGIPYMIEHGRTGLLVDINDHDAMAQAALRLLDDPDLAASMVTRARAVAEKYTWEGGVGAAWLGLYQRLAGRPDLAAEAAVRRTGE